MTVRRYDNLSIGPPSITGDPADDVYAIGLGTGARVLPNPQASVSPLQFGAKFDGVTDDSAAWQSAINALPQTGNQQTSGGVILLPPGDSLVNSPLIGDGLNNITFRGIGSRYGGTRLKLGHNGTGISLIGAFAPVIEQLCIASLNTAYPGKLVDVTQANFPSLRDFRLYVAPQAGSTAIHVACNKAITLTARDGYITGGGKGLDGCALATDFCNAVTVDKIYFDQVDTIPLHNLGAASAANTIIRDCVFEPLRSGAAGAYLQDATVPLRGTLMWLSNWVGDGNGTGTWVTFNGDSLLILSDFENADNAILLNGETRALAVGGFIRQGSGKGGINLNGQVVRSFKNLGLYGSSPTNTVSGTSSNYGSGGGGSLGSAEPFVQAVKTATQSIVSGTSTVISWDALGVDTLVSTGIQWTNTNPTRLVCIIPGIYRVSATVVFAANATGERVVWFRKSAATFLPGARGAPDPNGTAPSAIQAATTVVLNAGDYVECFCQQASGGALNVQVNDAGLNIPTVFDMVKIG